MHPNTAAIDNSIIDTGNLFIHSIPESMHMEGLPSLTLDFTAVYIGADI
jgi:hypothetical protein